MIIDGSYGEGGGQILRTAVALSCILKREITVENIRKGRRNPGLKNQHLHGIKLAARMCDARVEGLKIGSTRIVFRPGDLRGGRYEVDIGTAGSISLILQVAVPIAIASKERVELRIRGGTDVPFSPPIDYYLHVLFPLLERYGAKIEGKVIQRGYYPEGGGEVRITVHPSNISEIALNERGKSIRRRAYINLRNLPEHVWRRMENALQGFEVVRDVENTGISRGCGVVLAEEFENTVIGADNLCRKGVRAEKVVGDALKNLEFELRGGATVDRHMGDHLPVFSFMSREVEYMVSELTNHARTNLWLVEKFGGRVRVEGRKIRVHAYM